MDVGKQHHPNIIGLNAVMAGVGRDGFYTRRLGQEGKVHPSKVCELCKAKEKKELMEQR